MAIEKVHPLVIRTQSGEIIDVSLMNDKSYSKSLERGELWHLHRETGRVLPFDEQMKMQSLKGRPSWYEAVLSGAEGAESSSTPGSGPSGSGSPGSGSPGSGARGEEAQGGERFYDEPAALRHGAQGGQIGAAGGPEFSGKTSDQFPDRGAGRPPEATYGGPGRSAGPGEYGESGCGSSLELLEQTILQRKATLPEGSYTTHLFSSGEEKIRKKTGEEAVELLLANEDERIVSEAADLIYHLVVLLAYRQIPIASVCGELNRRAEGES